MSNYNPTVYIVTQHAPGCLPDSDPVLVTLNEEEANTCHDELAIELSGEFYLADMDEMTLREWLALGNTAYWSNTSYVVEVDSLERLLVNYANGKHYVGLTADYADDLTFA